jgi:alkylation response protein AidB-like acyl-CoA dehydrogenase
MDFTFSKEQILIKNSIREFFVREDSRKTMRENLWNEKDFSTELWEKISDLGWLGLSIPESYGGSSLGFQELVILFEEFGRACFISPVLSAILCGLLIHDTGNERQKNIYLKNIVTGKKVFSLAIAEPGFYYQEEEINLKAIKKDNNYILDGIKLFVSDAKMADFIICLAKTTENKTSLFVLESNNPKIRISRVKSILGDWQYEVSFDKVNVSSKNILGKLNRGWSYTQNLISKAALLKSAEMYGGAFYVQQMCTEYAKKRKIFNKSLGSFQVIQHRLSEMLIDINMSKDLVYKSAWMIDNKLKCDSEIAMAKSYLNEVYKRVVQSAHQIFGGIGFCEEYDLFLYLRHSKSCEVNYGDSSFQREIIASQMFS